MFSLLWHLRGSFELDDEMPTEAALDRVAHLFERQRKLITARGSNSLAFDAPLWSDMFGPNWQAMVIYDRGRVWIDQGLRGRVLRYELRSLHGFVFCLFAAAMFFVFCSLADGLTDGLKFAAFAFGWLYGMNVLLALLRVPPLFRRTVRTG